MTTTQLQLRRDTTANIGAITPAQGEPIYDVTRKALVLGDGATVGGLCVTPIAGTWTPTLMGSSTAGSPTYTTQAGDYFNIGGLVIAWFYVAISAVGGMTGNLEIGGLPVAASSSAGEPYGGCLVQVNSITLDSGYTQFGIEVPNGGNFGLLAEVGSNKTSQPVPVANVAAASSIIGTLIYKAAPPTA